jgi:hypothetical protein
MSMELISLPVTGLTITRVCFDYAIVLLMDDGSELRLQVAMSMEGKGVPESTITPQSVGPHASWLAGLLHREMVSALIDPSGRVEIEIEGPARIVVAPHSQYEAWTYAGPSGQKAVCLPGGGVTTWDLST